MATRARDISSLILPVRARLVQACDEGIPVKLALADYIADLPGIRVVDQDPVDGFRKVDVQYHPPATSRHKRRRPMFLCRVGSDSIVISGLNDRDRHQVLSRGWGRLHPAGISLYLPRDEQELDIAWRILSHAYDALVEASASAMHERAAWIDDLPRYSRTNLN
jgi:hypothetical protein